MKLAFTPYKLHFKEPGGTSRGVLHDKLTYLIKVWDEHSPEHFGIGEAAVFKGLSKEAGAGYEYKLIEVLANVALGRATDLTDYPSIQFGLEQAILDFSNGCRGIYFPSPFTQGMSFIEINGLVWMGNIDTMMSRLEEKIASGFKCIKLKIGAINFHDELKMLQAIRNRFTPDELEIRVDANGGFNMDSVIAVLAELAKYSVHSIEQPIPAGNWELMHFLCEISPIPVALDEELIGLNRSEEKEAMLSAIKPNYIILKPSLCGGISGSAEWIELAEKYGCGWWVTSALESNVGLNALAQWVATLGVQMPQGLGTGALFTNNFTCPLSLNTDKLSFNPEFDNSYRQQFLSLPWRE
ncbi:MAG: o-succinylbenzoate synthase [Prevotella sp.]|nr:o-succinylbenzoate synthase [Prevotella sp.]MCM1074284.1 o-succinylbenzoate synthase [Ruminococcus sp.]